jgi:hypothetical protein
LPPEMYEMVLERFAKVFWCSVEELKRISNIHYNAGRWYNKLSDTPNLPFQVAKKPNNYITGVGNTDWNLWVCSE